jgi:hypothetical protein
MRVAGASRAPVREGGLALNHGDPARGTSIALSGLSDGLGRLADIIGGDIACPQLATPGDEAHRGGSTSRLQHWRRKLQAHLGCFMVKLE